MARIVRPLWLIVWLRRIFATDLYRFDRQPSERLPLRGDSRDCDDVALKPPIRLRAPPTC